MKKAVTKRATRSRQSKATSQPKQAGKRIPLESQSEPAFPDKLPSWALKKKSGWVGDPEGTKHERHDDGLHKHKLPAVPIGLLGEDEDIRPVHPWDYPSVAFLSPEWLEHEQNYLRDLLEELLKTGSSMPTQETNYRRTEEALRECIDQLQSLGNLLLHEGHDREHTRDVAIASMRYAALRYEVGARLHSQHLEAQHRQQDGNLKRGAAGLTTLQKRTQSQIDYFKYIVSQNGIDVTKSGWVVRVRNAWARMLPEGQKKFRSLPDRIPSEPTLYRFRKALKKAR